MSPTDGRAGHSARGLLWVVLICAGVLLLAVVLGLVSGDWNLGLTAALVGTTMLYVALTYRLALSAASQADASSRQTRMAAVPFIDVRIGPIAVLADDAAPQAMPEARLSAVVSVSSPVASPALDMVIVGRLQLRHPADGEQATRSAMFARRISSVRPVSFPEPLAGTSAGGVEVVNLYFDGAATTAMWADINRTHDLLKQRFPSGEPMFVEGDIGAEMLAMVGGPHLAVRVLYKNSIGDYFMTTKARCLLAFPHTEQLVYPATGNVVLSMSEALGCDRLSEPVSDADARAFVRETFPWNVEPHMLQDHGQEGS